VSEPEPKPMLKMAKIGKVYRTGLVETAALEDLTLEIARGDFVSLMGPSGSGKTTFLNIAGLLDTFDVGTYHLDGVDVATLSDDRLSRLRNERIGFIFQSFNLIPDLDVYDNVEVPLRYRRLPPGERRDRVEEVLVQMGLTARMRHLPAQLSGGQQQRVAIARALVGRPQLLLADEPTGNLDTIASRQVLDLLEKINEERQTTILMVTHDPALAARARRKLHVLDGRLIDPNAGGGPPTGPNAGGGPPAGPRTGGAHAAVS
jgi:putative ABC transport system ATP-binding protein